MRPKGFATRTARGYETGRVDSTDQQLLLDAKRGDAAAVDALLAKYERQIFRFGLRMCGNEDDARDVLQETLLAAFKGVHEFRGDAQLSTWLYQVARSFCVKQHRRHVGEPAVTEPLDSPQAERVRDPAPEPDRATQAMQIGRLLQEALLELPEGQREVVVLRDVEGLSAEEAARVLGLDVPALKSRLHRGRAALRALLSGKLGEAPEQAPGCAALANELAAYAAEDIDQATCARIEQHLSECPRCTAACNDLKHTVSLCAALPQGKVPERVRKAVRSALTELSTA